jgi:glycosyltransferase involved in cell wall biosynthesis
MAKIVLGLLGDKTNPKYSHLWENISTALTKNKVKFYFIDDFSDLSQANAAKINLLFTIDEDGTQKWQTLITPLLPLVIWSTKSPIECIPLVAKYKNLKKFVLLSMSTMNRSYLELKYPDILAETLMNAINVPNIIPVNEHKEYDVTYISDLMDLETYKDELKKEVGDDAYIIVKDIIEYLDRNPEATIWDAYRLNAIIYNYDLKDYQLFIDVYNKIVRYAGDLKKIKIIEQLTDINLNIWGPVTWKKYAKGNIKYQGELPEEKRSEVFKQSKIVLNIMDYKNMHSMPVYILEAIAAGTLVLTDYDSLLLRSFPVNAYDIYYSPNDKTDIAEKINYYLNNDQENIELTKRLYNEVKARHSWKTRMNEFTSIFKAEG